MDRHEHNWLPVMGWPGRYQCGDRNCRVLGYRGVIEAHISEFGTDAQKTEIVPYRCQGTREGATCGRPAQCSSRRGRFCFSCAQRRRHH